MANPSIGRPRLPGRARNIRLRSSVYDLWHQRKISSGYHNNTDSEFAEFLLHKSSRDYELDESGSAFVSSTPLGKRKTTTTARRSPRIKKMLLESHASASLDVDVTGTSSRAEYNQSILNSAFGNPFSVNLQEEPSEESQSESSDDAYEFEVRMDAIVDDLCKTDDESEASSGSDMHISEVDDEATLTMVEDVFPDDEPTMLSMLDVTKEISEPGTSNVVITPEETTFTSPSGSVDLQEAFDLIASEAIISDKPGEKEDESMGESADNETQENSSTGVKTENQTVEGNIDAVLSSLQSSFSYLTSTAGLEELIELHSTKRVIVSVQKLIELRGDLCLVVENGVVCGKVLEYWGKHCGSRFALDWKCENGHFGKWESSEVLTINRYSKVFANDYLISAALVLSGNNFAKFELFCKALNLVSLSKTTFCHFQSHCAVPVVKNSWETMSSNVVAILKLYKDVCLSGEGRNDSPGHSARYCVYSLMEHNSKAIVDVSVIDKRETGGNSVTMEKEGLRRLLEKLMKEMTVSEICTDASTSIIKLVREMKGKFPELSNIFHSLDVWHKSKKLSKSLHKAAKVKGCSELKVWIEPIVNHFWYCAQCSKGNVSDLKSTWEGVLHHVCGEHKWAESECKHGPQAEEDESKPPLAKSSKAMEALRKIVLDVKWLKSLHFYVRFRHTGELESFNSMLTKYAPKRIAFEYPYFIMRILLAAIDHNFHLFRKPKVTADGKLQGHRKYSKRSQRYHAEIVKEGKTYDYFPSMAAKMLQNRILFQGNFQARADVDEFDPKQISPTIGMMEPPPTEQLMNAPTRFNFEEIKKKDSS